MSERPAGDDDGCQVPQDRCQQVDVADRDRPEPTGLAGIAVAERRPVRAVVEPAPTLLGSGAKVERVGGADELAIETVDRTGQPAMALPIRRPYGAVVE